MKRQVKNKASIPWKPSREGHTVHFFLCCHIKVTYKNKIFLSASNFLKGEKTIEQKIFKISLSDIFLMCFLRRSIFLRDAIYVSTYICDNAP